jgi:two-component system nitrate/nitrite response regulator NarL
VPVPNPRSDSRSVLLVEDDPSHIEVFKKVFEGMGGHWTLCVARDGLSAMAALDDTRSRFSLALVDIALPDISGVEVIEAARKRRADLPIMVTTAFTGEETFLSAIRAGARGYLLKSDSRASLTQSIQQVLQGHYPVSPALARHLFRLAGSPSTRQSDGDLNLTPREVELLNLIAQGLSYSDCADIMNVSLSTVQTHIRNMYRKLEVNNQTQAINRARSSGLLSY